MEDYSSIYNKGRNNNFSKALDDEISWDARVLELGCGTGQLSLFLGRGARDVHGLDISIGSLSLAEDLGHSTILPMFVSFIWTYLTCIIKMMF